MKRSRKSAPAGGGRRAGPLEQPRGGGLWRPAVIVLAVAAIYWGSLSAPFMFDDRPAIAQNIELRQWPDVVRVLKSAPPETPLSGRPVASLTFGLNYAAGGLDVRGYRFVNLAVHAACALLLFAVVRRSLAEPRAGYDGRFAPPVTVAFGVALIWAVHPLNSEVVCYLSQRTDSLMALFALLAVLASARARESARPRRWEALAVASAALGMACKETMVVAPVLIVLYDRVFVFASFRDAFKARGPFYAAVAASWAVLAWVMLSTPRTFHAGFSSTDPSPWHYLLNQSVVITKYLTLSVWPRSLVLFYGWALPTSVAAVWPHLLFMTALVVLSGVALWRRPALGFLGAWFFITLAPTSSIAPIVGEVGAERRMYLPLVAVVTLGILGAIWIWRRVMGPVSSGASARERLAGGAALTIVGAALGVGTILRTQDYASPLQMARTVYERWPSGAAAHMLGTELIAAGRKEEALPYLREGADTYPPNRFTLGVQLFEAGSFDAAVTELRRFVQQEPNLDLTRRAELLIAEGLARQQRFQEAIDWLKALVAKSPHRVDVIGTLADTYFSKGEFPAAIESYQTFLTLSPGQPEALANLAVAFVATGRLNEAIGAFRQVVQLQPANLEATLNLARALLDRGDPADVDEAQQMAMKGAAAMPRGAPPQELIGRALEARGDRPGARAAYERALQFDPTYLPAREGLARVARPPAPAPGIEESP
jgi:tetratricopeptide (TPR) repeat protein